MAVQVGEASLRHAQYYASLLEQGNQMFLNGGEQLLDGLALFNQNEANIRSAQAWVSVQQQERGLELRARFANAGAHVVELRLSAREKQTWFENALQAAQALGLPDYELAYRSALGSCLGDLGESLAALEHLHQALAAAREMKNRSFEGTLLGQVGAAYLRMGQY